MGLLQGKRHKNTRYVAYVRVIRSDGTRSRPFASDSGNDRDALKRMTEKRERKWTRTNGQGGKSELVKIVDRKAAARKRTSQRSNTDLFGLPMRKPLKLW